jgi:cytochrome c-type biogenesis protein CcmH/NrfG
MGAHTWFIIAAVGAFLAWCISYVLELQKEKLKTKPQRSSLLRQKEELLDRLAELDAQKKAGTLAPARYDKEFKKIRNRLADVLSRLGHKQDSTES